ncbi:MAG: hypothetical protein U1A78_09910 [Polyangia bacterium]
MKNFLFKKQREALNQLQGLVDGVADIDPASFFTQFDDGFRDSGACASDLLIKLPGPKEASRRAHLHVEERYSTVNPHDLVHYRYEICWQFDRDISAAQDDYLRDSLITLRRGVRFDHHPGAQDAHHPKYHWHPNGCSEFRLESDRMSTLKTALVATIMFDRERLEKLTDARFTNSMAELRKAIPGLP